MLGRYFKRCMSHSIPFKCNGVHSKGNEDVSWGSSRRNRGEMRMCVSDAQNKPKMGLTPCLNGKVLINPNKRILGLFCKPETILSARAVYAKRNMRRKGIERGHRREEITEGRRRTLRRAIRLPLSVREHLI